MNDQDLAAIVEKMASLARMQSTSPNFDRFSEKVRAVLTYVEQLSELDTTGIEPTSHAVTACGGLREDTVQSSTMSEAIISAAPERDGPFVQVPKVIDSE